MTISSLKGGDVIEVDIKGRQFYAGVREISGRTVRFSPLDSRITWRECTSHQVIGIWKATKATAERKGFARASA